MGHLGQGTEITTVQDKEIVLTASNGQNFRMKIADLAEAVRQVMPVATQEQHGLLNKNMFSMLDSGLTPFNSTSNTTDINQLFKERGAGLSMYTLVSAAINSPGAGFLLHFQRLGKGSVLAGSQMIFQLVILMSGEIICRSGTPNGTGIDYSTWV